MRRLVAGMAFAGILLTPGCGLRYDVVKPPSMQRKRIVSMESFQTFRDWKPKPSELPSPKALEKESKLYNLSSVKEIRRSEWLKLKGR